MNYIIRMFSIGFVLLFSACDKNDLQPEMIIVQVASQYRDCMGVGPQKCLWIKIEGNANWTLHYSGVEGFIYEEGFEYTLAIKQKQVTNPPMDGSSIRYILVNIISKTKI